MPTQTDDTEAGGSVKTRLSKPANKSSPADDIPETPHAQPRPRPRPRTQNGLPETLSPLTPLQDDETPTAGSSVNVNSGIPEDESDTEEYAAAKSSPIKAGKRVTSAVCDSNSLTYFLMLTSP